MTAKRFLTVETLKSYLQHESWQFRDIHDGIQEANTGLFAAPKAVSAVFTKYGA